jgi:hypothetical protein
MVAASGRGRGRGGGGGQTGKKRRTRGEDEIKWDESFIDILASRSDIGTLACFCQVV